LGFAAGGVFGALSYFKSKGQFEVISEFTKADNKPLLFDPKDAKNGQNDLSGWIFNNRKIIIKEELGRGGMGIVYRAEKEGQPCVVKRLLKKEITNRDFKIIQGLRRLVHPSLVQILGICPNYTTPKKLMKPHPKMEGRSNEMKELKPGSNDLKLDRAFLIAYELLEVGPLFHALHDTSRRFDWRTRKRIALSVAQAMELLHSQKPAVVHGNLSSVNVLLDADLVAKVSDFGMDSFYDYKKTTHSPLWTAPEVLKGQAPRKESDVFAFGIILWELMTRRVPYVSGVGREGGNVRWQQVQRVKNGARPPVPEGLPEVVSKLIEECWLPNPSKRPPFNKIVQVLAQFPLDFNLSRINQVEVKVEKNQGPEAIDIVIPSKMKWMQEADNIELEGPNVRTIGQGSFGRVIATNWNGTRVAVKLIDMYSEVTRAQAQAFITELSILCGLRHPNVVLFQGAVLSHEKYMCIIMELCERNSLYDVLHDKSELMDYKMQVKILTQLAEAMDYLHHGFRKDKPVLHCDLKSGNILLTESYDVKVCDFGLSQIVQKRLSAHSAIGADGNPYWTAPEVMAGGNFSKASDVYSYAIVAWEVFARKRPFTEMNPHQATLAVLMEDARPSIPDFVPNKLAELINSCWHKDAKQRLMFPEILTRLKKIVKEGLPREVLTLKNAKLYQKKTLVYAFRSKDRFTFNKVWGKSMSNPNDYVIVGPGGDAYTCAADRFEATYREFGNDPHVYRKATKILAKKMENDFLIETLEGLEKGDAGSYLAQNPSKLEQWPIDKKTFDETYVICSNQSLDEVDTKIAMTPVGRTKKRLAKLSVTYNFDEKTSTS